MTNIADSLVAFSTVLQTFAVVVTAAVAIWGINQWRRQQVGKRRLEIAEETLSAFYEVQGVIGYARAPFGYAEEGTERPRIAGETESLARTRDSYYRSAHRLCEHEDLFAKLRTLRLLCKVHFGEKSDAPFGEMSKVRHEIAVAVRMLIATAGDKEVERKLKREWQETIWSLAPDDHDKIAKRAENAVRQAERICRAYL